MCRITDYSHHHHHKTLSSSYNHGRLRLNSFTLTLSLSSSTTSSYFPEFLSLVFLPRINDSPLEINGSKVRPDSPAFLTLHRTHRVPSSNCITFAANDRVVASDGTVFEVHVGDRRLLTGVFREKAGGINEWSVECKCVAESDGDYFAGVNGVEVYAMREGDRSNRDSKVMVIMGMVEVKRVRKKSCLHKKRFKLGLEEIPEERECDVEDDVDGEEGSGGYECRCCGMDEDLDGGDEGMGMMEEEMERVRWAVDVGIWVACLGVGLFLSRASAKKFLRRNSFV